MVIDENQSAFMKGRGLLESALVANEVIEEVRRRRRSGVFLKVDFEKAYDSVRWSFLFDMLNRLGFHVRWIKWVQGCLESATISILVNGSPTKEFRPGSEARGSYGSVLFSYCCGRVGWSSTLRLNGKPTKGSESGEK